MSRFICAAVLVLAVGCGDGGKAETAKKNAEHRKNLLVDITIAKDLVDIQEKIVESTRLRIPYTESSRDDSIKRLVRLESDKASDRQIAELQAEIKADSQKLFDDRENLPKLEQELATRKQRLAEMEAELLKYPEQPAN